MQDNQISESEQNIANPKVIISDEEWNTNVPILEKLRGFTSFMSYVIGKLIFKLYFHQIENAAEGSGIF